MDFKIKINNVDYTEYATLPLNTQSTIDDSLDVGFVKLSNTKISQSFTPLDNVEISVTDDLGNSKTYYFCVSSDVKTEIILKKEYNHEIALIEQTKNLERICGIVKTNTKVLTKDYGKAQSWVALRHNDVVLDLVDGSNFGPGVLRYTPKSFSADRVNVLGAQELLDIFKRKGVYDYIKLGTNPKNWEVFANGKKIGEETPQFGKEFILTEENEGTWKVVYHFIEKTASGVPVPYDIYYNAVVLLGNKTKAKNYTITDVIDNLLATCECLNEQETPRYKLNDKQAVEFAGIEAPDFSLGGTLWECLNQIGGYIHSVPRLEQEIVYFDKLGSNEKSVQLEDYCSNTELFNVDQFATELNSVVDNIVNTDNKEQGTISAPFDTCYSTVRAENGIVQITDSNFLIKTRLPIEEVLKVECGYLKNGKFIGDITPYIFESAEYETLSEYDLGYPLSKNFALKYTQGQPNITGLNFKVENAISPVFSNYSIVNIILSQNADVKPDDVISSLLDLQFRVTYIPIVSANVKQFKASRSDFKNKSMLDFNQSANKINSFYYGENMKGTLAKLGNPEITKVFILKDLTKIPKVGTLYSKDYYISIVKVEYYEGYFKCEVALSKNYNKLNQYVGIDSQKRFYQISEKQAVDRFVNYSDFCVIGNYNYIGDDAYLITRSGWYELGYWMRFSHDENQTDLIKCKGISGNKELEETLLPINSFSVGNSSVFSFSYVDNFSAGNTKITKDRAKLQSQLKYTDNLGGVEKLKFDIGKIPFEVYNYEDAVKIGDTLPSTKNIENYEMTTYFSTGEDKKILLLKDNREVINFTYQINFIGDDNSFIIGSSLASDNSLVKSCLREKGKKAWLVTSPQEIGKFDLSLDYYTIISDTLFNNSTNNGFYLNLSKFKTTQDAKSWAIMYGNPIDGEGLKLLVGQNMEIKAGDTIKDLYFNFTHKI